MKAAEVLKRYKVGERDFRNANLQGQSFRGQDLSDIDISGACIQGTNFTKAILRSAKFRNVKTGLQFYWAIIASCLLSGISGFCSTETSHFLINLVYLENNVGLSVSLAIAYLLVFGVFFVRYSRPLYSDSKSRIIIEDSVRDLVVFGLVMVVASFYYVYSLQESSTSVAFVLLRRLMFMGGVPTVGFAVVGTLVGAVGIAVAITGARSAAVTETRAVVIAVSVAVLEAGSIAIFRDGSTTGLFVIVVAISEVFTLFSAYIGFHAMAGNERYLSIRKGTSVFAAIGGTSFRKAFLINSDFTKAMIQSTDLRGAILTPSCWNKAEKLDFVRIETTALEQAKMWQLKTLKEGQDENFTFYNLQEFNLQGANLQNAKLDRTSLREANLQNAKLNGTSLQGADLQNADLSRANLQGANLQNADLSRANLQGANLQNADLSRANLQGVNLQSADLSRASLKGADLQDAKLNGTNLQGADLQDVKLNGSNLQGVNLQSADLSRANLQEANLKNAKLNDTNLQEANLQNADLSRANLQEANLQSADLSRANLQEANLQNANFLKADLSAASLQGANLSGAWLVRTLLYQVDLTRAVLTGACIEEWQTNNTTNLQDIICDYTYLRDGQQERRPSGGNFGQGEFTKLFQKALETVDLIFRNGIDWQAFLTSFEKLQVECDGEELSIQAIENKNDGAFVIRVNVPLDANKVEVEKFLKREYELALKTIDEKYSYQLQAKDEQLAIYRQQSADLTIVMKMMADRPINIEARAVAESKSMSEASKYDQRGANIGNFVDTAQAGSHQQSIQYNYSPEQRQTLAETADEIQRLLKQLEKNNPTATEVEKQAFVNLAISPTRKQRLLSALQVGWQEALKEFLDNPYLNVGLAIIEGWKAVE